MTDRRPFSSGRSFEVDARQPQQEEDSSNRESIGRPITPCRTMRSCLAVCCLLAVIAATISSASAKPQIKGLLSRGYNFAKGTVQGSRDMYRAYSDMREANWKDSDRYFHARGNSDAAKRGAGGRFAATAISNGREWFDRNIKGDSAAASARDQAANRHGRRGGNLNKYRPKGLPKKY